MDSTSNFSFDRSPLMGTAKRGNNNNMFAQSIGTTQKEKTVLHKKGDIDRSNWMIKVAENNPAVHNLRERLSVINRGIAFSKMYNKGRLKGAMRLEDVVKLIIQYLEFEGLTEAKGILEKESGITLKEKALDNRIITLLKIVLERTEEIYDLTMDDKEIASKNQKIENALSSLGLLREDVEIQNLNQGISLWDEHPEDGFLYATPEGGEVNYYLEGSSIRALSLNQIIILLTPIQASTEFDQNQYNSVILLTQNSFSTQEQFLQKLIERYQVPVSPDLSPEEQSQRATTIRLRVLNIIKKWIDTLFYSLSDKVCQMIHDFMKGEVMSTLEFHGSNILQTLNLKMASRTRGEIVERDGEQKSFDIPPPPPIIPRAIFLPTLSWVDIDPEELARQLTLMDYSYFQKIRPTEFLDQSWSKARLKHNAKNLLTCINRFNIISDWSAAQIVTTPRLKDRIKVWSRLITLATELLKLNNFNAVMAMLSAFNTASIGRLQFTIDGLEKSDRDAWNYLSSVLDSSSGFVNYRRTIENTTPPAVPYLGLFTQDLTFIDDGNEDVYKGLINWKKRELTGTTILKIMRFLESAYNLQPIYQISYVLKQEIEYMNPKFRDEKELYRASLEAEPRNSKKSHLK